MPLQGEATYRATYLNLEPIGQGTSEVHRAHHAVYDRPVIQKTVSEAALVQDSIVANEPRLLLAIDHEAIPRIHEAQFDPQRRGQITFVMDKVGDLSAGEIALGHLERPSTSQLVSITLQLLSALDHLHVTHNVCHRDIKPDNILLSADLNQAWLIDFSLAGLLDDERTLAGVQTPIAWMAPEVPMSLRYTIQSEIYSLGVVLYELATGRLLMSEYAMERQEDRITQGMRPFPDSYFKEWPPEVPSSLRRMINKAIAKDPTDRWQTASRMRAAIGQLVYVDWQLDPSQPGRWEGSWPSSRSDDARLRVEVTTRELRSGPDAGRMRAIARYMPTKRWRRLPGLADRTYSSPSELSHFFEDVASRLASIRPS